MSNIIKNIEDSKSLTLKSQIDYKENSVEQLILAKNQGVTMILLLLIKEKRFLLIQLLEMHLLLA